MIRTLLLLTAILTCAFALGCDDPAARKNLNSITGNTIMDTELKFCTKSYQHDLENSTLTWTADTACVQKLLIIESIFNSKNGEDAIGLRLTGEVLLGFRSDDKKAILIGMFGDSTFREIERYTLQFWITNPVYLSEHHELTIQKVDVRVTDIHFFEENEIQVTLR